MKLNKLQQAFLLISLTVVTYANTLQNGFVWDDVLLVSENQLVRNFSYVAPAFTRELYQHVDSGTAYYRPLQTISYMADYQLWGLNPFGYHLTNLLLHLGCVLLLWTALRQCGAGQVASLAVAAVFAVHPVNANAVSYIAGRADPLCFAAMLSALNLFILYRRHPEDRPAGRVALYVGCVLCFALALFSRENALLFPALALLYCGILDPRLKCRWKSALAAVLPLLLLAGAFLLWRSAVLSLQPKPLLTDLAMSPALRTELIFRGLATYLGLLFWPANLQMERQVIFGGPHLQWLTVAGILGALGLAAAIWWSRSRLPLAFFGWCWFVVTVLPLTGLFNLPATLAEHWLYVPAAGFWLALIVTLVHAAQTVRDHLHARVHTARLLAYASLVAALSLSVRTAERNRDWSDGVTIFTATREAAPGIARIRNNLAHGYLAHGRTGDALRELETAERLDPTDADTKSNLAAVHLQQGNLELARAKLRECLALDPRHTRALMRLAAIEQRLGNIESARRHHLRAAATARSIEPQLAYGQFLLQHGRHRELAALIQNTWIQDPGNAEVYNLLGALHTERGRFDEAAQAFQRARRLDRHSPNALLNLGYLATLRGEFADAESCYRRALRIQPDNVRAHYQLGMIAWQRGRLDSATASMWNALYIEPQNHALLKTMIRLRRNEPFPAARAVPGHS
jgi:Flp pilus assembly protein TadD